jgi:hypothetical protein
MDGLGMVDPVAAGLWPAKSRFTDDPGESPERMGPKARHRMDGYGEIVGQLTRSEENSASPSTEERLAP